VRTVLLVGVAACVQLVASPHSATAFQSRQGPHPTPRESRIPVGNGSLYVRDVGNGSPVIVLHGGPDFDIRYLLPDLDRLADSYHLIYYDQRGRGKSAARVRPEDVSLASDVEDIDRVRDRFHLEQAAVLGHSWGAVLALEYALRHPTRVSRLILMNPAPASTADYAVLRSAYIQKLGKDFDRQREILASAAYKEGDPETVAARYRLHFEAALARSEDYETLMARMKAAFVSQGKAGILKARAVEDRLKADSWSLTEYDLLPKLAALNIPTLVIAGDKDFIPAEIAQHIASAIPGAQLVTLRNCGHFSYLECPTDVRKAFDDFFHRAGSASPSR
jgi:proline iminopeptidase